MNKQKFDLIVLGTGPASGTVAKKVAESGKSVAIIESREFGGTCALRGCNPKKVYANASNLMDRVRTANGKLATFGENGIDWGQLQKFQSEFVEPVAEKSEDSFRDAGIKTFLGSAVFTGPNTIELDGNELEAERFFIGTGGTPRPLEIEGDDLVTRSDKFFELQSMPSHVTFVGGGFISMEFAHVVARHGSKVVVIDRNPQPLKHFDPDLVKQLMDWSTSVGIEFICDATVDKIRKSKDGDLQVDVTCDGETQTIDTQLVVHGAGRVPNLSSLNLDAANVSSTKQGIEVDAHLRTSNPNIFAAGDCADTNMPRLTPIANEQARMVVKNLFKDSPEQKPDYGAVPKVVFTAPCLASVGLSEAAAKEKHGDVDVRFKDTSSWSSVKKTGQECAGYKLLIDRQTDRILGAHLLGPAAEETINLFVMAMKFDLTSKDIKSTLFAYPTFASDVRFMV